MKELFKLVSKKILLICIALSIITTISSYGQSFSLAYYGNNLFNIENICKLSLILIVFKAIELISSRLQSYIDNTNIVRIKTNIQKYYFNKFEKIPVDKITNIHTGYINNLINNVAIYYSQLIVQIEISIIPLIIGGISITIMICNQSVFAGIISIIISIIAVIVKYRLILLKENQRKERNSTESKFYATLIDFIQNIVTVKKLNIINFSNDKLNKDSIDYMNAVEKNEKKRTLENASFTAILNLLYVVAFISTIYAVKQGKNETAYLLFYISSIEKLSTSLNNFVGLLFMNENFITSKKQLDSYFKEFNEEKIIQKFDNISLKDIKFSYNINSTVINIPDFKISKGDKVCITGESGQGKTTAINILAGLYKISNGKLIIDGIEKNDIKLDIAFVSQEVDLFDINIRENLCLGKNIKDEKLIDLIEEAGMKKWYQELPNGLDSKIGEHGIKLSTGQKQRLNLIRGILLDKEIYFLDEPTSNLDSLSEEKIIRIIEKYLKNKTCIIITHGEKLKRMCNKYYYFENHIMKIEK